MIDFSADFDSPSSPGLAAYLWYKTRIGTTTLVELLGLLAIIKTVSAIFQRSVIEIFNRVTPKLYVFSLLMIVPTFLGAQFRVPFMTATLSAYQFSYL